MDVTLEPVGAERAETLSNLFQLYVHDFSDFWETRRVEIGEDGRFPPYPPLARYWTEPDRRAFLIRADGRVAGFATLDRESHAGASVDHNVGDFFVARPYRRQGVGLAAARLLFSGRPGRWEIAVARRNLGALAFWRTVAAQAGATTERDRADTVWNGTVLQLSVGDA